MFGRMHVCDSVFQIRKCSYVIRVKGILLVLLFTTKLLSASSLSTREFMECIRSKKSEKMELFFLDLERNPPTLTECRKFLNELTEQLSLTYRIPKDKFSIDNAHKKISKLAHFCTLCNLQTAPVHLHGILSKKLLLSLETKYLKEELTDRELPSDFVIGLVEMFAGSLLMIIPNGYTRAAAAALFSRGFFQVMDSLKEAEIINEMSP